MTYKKSLISIGISTVLAGCSGGGSGDGSTPTPVSFSKACIDSNANAVCDDGETVEDVSAPSATEFSVTTTLTSSDYPLAYNSSTGYTLTAPKGASALSVDTTLMQNELIYNQVIENKLTADVDSYLATKLGTLTDENKQDIAQSIKQAVSTHQANHTRSAIIAAVINKIVVGGSVSMVTVTDAEVTVANAPTLNKLALTLAREDAVDDEIAQQDTDGWVDAKDASIRSIDAKNGKIIGGSHYHNGLVVMDATGSGVATLSPVSVVTDAGHGVDSASGVSENYLRDAVFSSDASFVYVNIPKKKASSTTADTETFGFYKAKVNPDNTIATTETGTGAVKVIKIAETDGGARLAEQVSMFAVAPDDSQVVLLDSENNLTVYTGDLATVVVSVEMPDVKSMVIDDGKLFITKGDEKVYILSLETLAETQTVTLNFVPDEVRVNHDLNTMVAFNHGHDNNGKMTIAVIKDDVVVNQGEVKFTSDSGAVSPDMTKIVLFGHEESTISIVNLTVPGFSIQATHEVTTRDASWVDNDNIAVISDRNSLAVINVEETDINVSLAIKIALGKAGLGPASINGGGFMNAIIKDVKLPTNYENVGITWGSENSALVVGTGASLGKGVVTRPDTASTDVTGELSASLSGTFRDETFADSVSFDTTVRKMPGDLGTSSFLEVGNVRNQYMAVSDDGSITALPTYFENASEKGFYGFTTFKLNSSDEPVVVSGTAEEPKVYNATESLAGVGISGNFVIGVAGDDVTPANARIFTVAIDDAGVMADTVTAEKPLVGGNPKSRGVGFSEDKTKIAVMVKNETTGAWTAEIFSVDVGTGALTVMTAIPMDSSAEYKIYGPPVVSNDGLAVYQRTEASVIKSDASSENAVEVPVNEVARVFSNNNFIFVNTYEGNIHTFDMDLTAGSEKQFSTGTGGSMYGGDVVGNYYYIPVRRAGDDFNGVYQLEIDSADGSLTEKAFTNVEEGVSRMAASSDSIFFTYDVKDSTGNRHNWLGVIKAQ